MGLRDNISAAVEAIGFSVKFDTQRNYKGKLEKFAQFNGFTNQDRELEYTEFYKNIAELPGLLRDRWGDYDVEEETERWLGAKNNGLQGVPTLLQLIDDCKEEEKLIWRLSEAVEAGLHGKLPEPEKTGKMAANEYDALLEAALSAPNASLTKDALGAVEKIVKDACGHDIRWLIEKMSD